MQSGFPPRPRRPRVGVDLRALVRDPTGIGIYTLELLRELARRDEFRLVGLSHATVESAVELRDLGIELEVESAPLGLLWQQLRLPKRLARGDLDLFWSPLLTLPTRLPIPAAVTLHDLAVLHHPETLPWRVRWSLQPFLDATVERAARILCISRQIEREITAVWPSAAGRTTVIYPGVSAEFRPADEVERRAIRERLGLPERFLLYVGTVEPRKNLELLLDAWSRLRAETATAPPLLVAGPEGWSTGATERRMRALVPLGLRRLGRLPRPDLVDTMRAATLFVYPSFYEGFGMPALEAMACGVPPIVANRSSLPEVVGDAGFQFDPDDADDLYAQLATCLDSPAELAAAAARAIERARAFSWPGAAAALGRVFEEILERPSPRPGPR